jgi:hypothetical protein
MSDSEHDKHMHLAKIFCFRGQLLDNKSEIKAELTKAHQHILLCNFNKSLSAGIWKKIIEENLKALD